MRSLPQELVDTVITDPPYGLRFMGNKWDNLAKPAIAYQGKPGIGVRERPWPRVALAEPSEVVADGENKATLVQRWHQRWASEALRVAKPGAMLLAFGGTRMFHRLACGIEDAGWIIRDCIMWLYGTGFPKSLNIAKVLAASEHQVTGESNRAAELWEGWGTGLKPAWEPIIVAMKPLDKTFARNAIKHGVAGLSIDGGRIGNDAVTIHRFTDGMKPFGKGAGHAFVSSVQRKGRWPANVVLSHHAKCRRRGLGRANDAGGQVARAWRCHAECSVGTLDRQSGSRRAGGNLKGSEPSRPFKNCYGFMHRGRVWNSYGDSGGTSRFFYCTKAGRKERNAGLQEGNQNSHPTVKPLALMEYLCRLTSTPTGGVVLDPFAGTGTTLIAAANCNRSAIGIELDKPYARIARQRISYWLDKKPC